MPSSDFSSFFQTATGKQPYDWQHRLACGYSMEEHGLSRPSSSVTHPCESQLISIPTGLGKTAGVIIAWLWNRVGNPSGSSSWPRRLVFCLPMRTLVEQTRTEAEKWLRAHNLLMETDSETRQGKVGLHILMGGEDTEKWDLYPEENAILIGTQDMLLSRALNRGYGMSRYRWPMHFALLNNDSLWVLDETQLMGVGVETSSQLNGFRHHPQWHRHAPCPTWWMSATLEQERLATVDNPAPPTGRPLLTLEQKDRGAVRHRLEASKRLLRASVELSKRLKPEQQAKELAKLVLEKHVQGQFTLVILNRVSRAQDLYSALQKAGRKEGLALVHSRFRRPDRQKHQDLLINGTGDRIVVATQAVEAGVDVSARILITELAPWSSLVQRFGRCNRGGEFNAEGADVYWINLDFDKDDDVAPYTLQELRDARTELEKLEGHSLSPSALSSVHVAPRSVIRPVIRRKDLVDLFDTTPDIAGHDLDISRYVREGDDTDVQVFWRELSASDFTPTQDTKEPARDELCRVAVYRFQAFLDKLKKATDGRAAFIWDGLQEKWRPETKARAGVVYLLDRRAGGYNSELGWTGEIAGLKKESEWTVALPREGHRSPDAATKDPLTRIGKALSLEEHTSHAVDQLQVILDEISLPEKWRSFLLTAAKWHDVGKAIPDFQIMLQTAAGQNAPEGILAKSGVKGGALPAWRRYFRHELASALAWLANNDSASEADLVAYIIAAHHGKVRLSIRSMPGEKPPSEHSDKVVARGILDGEKLPALSWNGFTVPETDLCLDLMRMGSNEQGRTSWLARMISLRDQHGPFTLAFLESLLRAADMRASAKESTDAIFSV